MTQELRDSLKALARRSLPGRSRGIPRVSVLCYHSVHPSSPTASVSSQGFRRQLEWLSDHCDVVSFDQVRTMADRGSSRRPVVAITFDDAFSDNYDHAWPLLAEFEMPATFFVTTGLVARQPVVIDRFARLLSVESSAIEPLSWAQMAEMRSGGMSIGAHSVTHPNLAAIEASAAQWEIETSRRILEDVLGEDVTSFAYPFGKPKHAFTSRTVAQVREAGFLHAGAINCRTLHRGEHPLRVPRIPVNNDSLDRLRSVIAGEDNLLGVWQERAPRWLSHLVSPDRSHRGEESLRYELTEDGP